MSAQSSPCCASAACSWLVSCRDLRGEKNRSSLEIKETWLWSCAVSCCMCAAACSRGTRLAALRVAFRAPAAARPAGSFPSAWLAHVAELFQAQLVPDRAQEQLHHRTVVLSPKACSSSLFLAYFSSEAGGNLQWELLFM